MFIVTTEGIDDGMWLDDPEGFDTELDAVAFVSNRLPPKGHCFAIYACTLLTTHERPPVSPDLKASQRPTVSSETNPLEGKVAK